MIFPVKMMNNFLSTYQIIVKMFSLYKPQVSSLTQHLEPKQKHQHPSNGYQSNRLDLVKHQHLVNQQKQHHHVEDYNVRVAKKFEFSNFHTISPNKVRSPIVEHSKKKKNVNR